MILKIKDTEMSIREKSQYVCQILILAFLEGYAA